MAEANPFQYNVVYMKPQNVEAREIWEECSFRDYEPDFVVMHTLEIWVSSRAEILTDGNYGDPLIRWMSGRGVKYQTTWPIFLKWFQLTCEVRTLERPATPMPADVDAFGGGLDGYCSEGEKN